jgi:hypothetical protein
MTASPRNAPVSLGTFFAQRARAAMKAAYDAEQAAREFRATDAFEQACTFLRTRGFAVFRAPAAPGEEPRWCVGSKRLTRDELMAMAARKRGEGARNLPRPVTITGEAPMAIVSTVRERAAPEPAEDKYRGIGADVVLEWLQALRPHFASTAEFALALRVPATSLSLALNGRQSPTAAMVAALFGPRGSEILPRWMELIAGGPVELPPPGSAAEEEAPPLGSAAEEEAPPPDGAGEQDSADVGDAGSEAVMPAAVDMGAGDLPPPAPAPEQIAGSPPPHEAAEPGAGGHAHSLPAPAEGPAAPMDAADYRPWSKLEDRDLVAILRGKLAGVREEIEALVAEEAALKQRLHDLNRWAIALDVRADALRAAIAEFAAEEEPPRPEFAADQEGEEDGC